MGARPYAQASGHRFDGSHTFDNHVKFLTYNAGLFDFKILGRSLIKPADWIEERFAALQPALEQLDADIVALQEVYEPRHKNLLMAGLSKTYPYASVSPMRGPSVVPASLMTLSKWPIVTQEFVRFAQMPLAEKLVDNKGFLVSSIHTPNGPLTVVNVHTTAGGTIHPEHPKTDRIRARQIEQLCQRVDLDRPVLFAGDFNCGSVSQGNYAQLLDAGYTDTWTKISPGDNGFTWEPTSILNVGGAHTKWGCPAQRIDLILLNQFAMASLPPTQVQRVFMDQNVRISDALSVTLSDHFGVLATLKANQRRWFQSRRSIQFIAPRLVDERGIRASSRDDIEDDPFERP